MASTAEATRNRKIAKCAGEYARSPARIPANADAHRRRATARATMVRDVKRGIWIPQFNCKTGYGLDERRTAKFRLPGIAAASRRPGVKLSPEHGDLSDVVAVVSHN